MLELNNLTISIEDRFLIKNLNLTLNKGDKLAIIGEEGNGKSTLLKAIVGKCDYAKVDGLINTNGYHIGYLPQSINEKYSNSTVKEYLFINEEDYYNKINISYKKIEVLNLNDKILNQTINTLSGGEKVKIGILKLLINEYDILFLDEPTNDLDIETLKWLEKFINNENRPIMFVSHDETLLANTANRILHLEQIKKKSECRHTLVSIGYDEYVSRRLHLIDKQNQIAKSEKREYDIQMEKYRKISQKVEYQLRNISRQDPSGGRLLKKKMHSVKAQGKKLENKELTHKADVEEHINFFFEDVYIPNNKVILDYHLDELKVDEKLLSTNINLKVTGNSHICIIGNNGVGKTTLLRLIYNNLNNRSDINVGYMSQNYDDILNEYEFVMDYIASDKDKETISKSRQYLGNMKFTSEEMEGKISDLSNGSKAKLILIKLVLNKHDVLLLDEPTRNVSPLSNPVIRKVLKEFKGCIISISHDRKYLDEVIDTLYLLSDKGLNKVNTY